MTTVLVGVVAGIEPRVLADAVPPACRGAIVVAAREWLATDDGTVLVTPPPWSVGAVTHLLPSFGARAAALDGIRLEVSARAGGAWSGWVAGDALGAARFPPLPSAGSLVVADVDVFRASAPVEEARVRVRLTPADVDRLGPVPWMLTLSASAATSAGPTAAPGAAIALDVPTWSQMEADAAIAPRICSPTCVGMVLGYHGRTVALDTLAAEIYHPGVDLYGVWPAAIRVAARHGMFGYLLRFPDWAAAAWCLARGLPVIASLRYARGELRGAAVPETSGHLVVLTGVEGGDVLVNDPAAPSAATVKRRYAREELVRAWLGGSGVGYVLFPGPPEPARRSSGVAG